MQNLNTYEEFVNEALGVVDYLAALADEIMARLEDESEFTFETTIRGEKCELRIRLFEKIDGEIAGYIRPIEEETTKNVFEISLLKEKGIRGTLIHELKHLDFHLRRKGKINDRISELYKVMRVTPKFYRYFKRMFASEKDLEDLCRFIYFCDKNEFESYYNDAYHHCLEKLKAEKDMSDEIKFGLVTLALSLEPFSFYRISYNYGFDIRVFFKSNRECNRFIDFCIDYKSMLDQMVPKTMGRSIWFYIRDLIGKTYDYFVGERETSKIVDEINKEINKRIKIYFKKMNRLYTALGVKSTFERSPNYLSGLDWVQKQNNAKK